MNELEDFLTDPDIQRMSCEIDELKNTDNILNDSDIQRMIRSITAQLNGDATESPARFAAVEMGSQIPGGLHYG